MSNEPQKILIINLTRLGDILQSRPLLQVLKNEVAGGMPAPQIDYLAVDRFAAVCSLLPEIDRVIPFDFGAAIAISKEAVRHLPRRLNEISAYLSCLQAKQYELIINLSHTRISALICHLLKAFEVRGLTLDREGFRQLQHPWARYFFTANLNRAYNRLNLTDVQIGLAQPGGLAQPDGPASSMAETTTPWKRPKSGGMSLKIPNEAGAKADELLQAAGIKEEGLLIGLQPGASLASKRWPSDCFADLGRRLSQELGARVVILGSPQEEALGQEVASRAQSGVVNLAGKTDIPTLAALLKSLDLLITNDTGTQHLAAAVGTRVLSLCFGSAFAHETGPYGEGHFIVEARIPCFPCSFHVSCPRFRCQELVSPAAIFDLTRLWLQTDVGTQRVAPPKDQHGRREWRFDTNLFDPINVGITSFDEDGFWQVRPMIKRPATFADYFSDVSRTIWKEHLLGGETLHATEYSFWDNYLSPVSDAFETERQACQEGLLQIQVLARQGIGHCDDLCAENAKPHPDPAELRRMADILSDLDRRVGVIGARQPMLNSLALDFTWGKENLQGHQIGSLTRQTRELYSRLELMAARFLAALQETKMTASSAQPITFSHEFD